MSERFVSDGTDFHPVSLCGFCKHKYLRKPACAAFPSGIPAIILAGRVHHTSPYAGDKGILFERDPSIDTNVVGEPPIEK